MSSQTFTSPTATSSQCDPVPNLISRRSINLIVGDSKSGRMRLALSQLDSYAASVNPTFLDHPVPSPVQLGCVLCNREEDRLFSDLTRAGLDNLSQPRVFPVVRWRPSENESDPTINFPLIPLYTALSNTNPATFHNHRLIISNGPPKLILIENIQLLLTSGKYTEQRATAVFLDCLRKFCCDNSCSVLATVGTPKMTTGYSLAHKISGSPQWADGSDTLIGIDTIKASQRNGLSPHEATFYRKLTIAAPGQPTITRWARFTLGGRLVLTDQPETDSITGYTMLDRMLAIEPPGREFTRLEFLAWGMSTEVSDRTIDRWLVLCLKNETLKKQGHAITTRYTKPLAN